MDAKYGWWLAKNRYNGDQVPLPFVIDEHKTYDITGNKQVWVSQPSTCLDNHKRQATLQLHMQHTEGEQNAKAAVVFRGKGKVPSAWRAEYDKVIDVYFEQCAWMGNDFNMQWLAGASMPGVGKSQDEKVIFADNVGF